MRFSILGILGLLLLLFVTNSVWAMEPQKLYGAYIWGKHVYLNETHKWENGLWQTVQGQERRKELKKMGYNCYRRSPEKFTCHWKSTHEELPSDVVRSAAEYIKYFKIEFPGPFSAPKDMIKTSTEREWWIEGQVLLNGAPIRGYKWTHSFEQDKNYVVLPVSDEQPIPWVIFHNSELLHLPFMLQQKDGPDRKTQYLVEVDLAQTETPM